MADSFAPSAALLRSSIVARGWTGDGELAHAYETGKAHTWRAFHGPRNVGGRRPGRFIEKDRLRVASPDRDASRRRKRSWAGSSRLPKEMREEFTEGERAALSIVAEQVKRNGLCDLPIDKIAALAGVSRTTCQNAFRKARSGASPYIAIQERPRPGRKNLTNIIRIVSQEWKRWLKNLIGFKKLNPSKTKNNNTTNNRREERPKEAFEWKRWRQPDDFASQRQDDGNVRHECHELHERLDREREVRERLEHELSEVREMGRDPNYAAAVRQRQARAIRNLRGEPELDPEDSGPIVDIDRDGYRFAD
ncbi:hypothetical protein [Martelella radicis]|uniref:Uncharacterized protein n=1 Tax=Martelella radicis TaxID=1397476 RepID=A0A7W6PCC6_9HYPH|nr:hypothetical protein [Martelella radicis]MBB4123297.1 hypothetical protein [Martelella radicis]